MRQTLVVLLILIIPLFNNCINNAVVKNKVENIRNSNSEENVDLATLSKTELEYMERVYEKDVPRNPSNIRLKRNLAAVKSTLNKHHEAINIFSEILNNEKSNCKYYQERAFVYLKVNSFPESIQDLSEAIKLCPQDLQSYKWRGYSYLQNKQYKEAVKDLSSYIEVVKTDKDAIYMRAHAFYFQNNLESACKDIKLSGYTTAQMEGYPVLQKCLTQ